MTKESGLALVEKYGKEYFRHLRAKVRHESLVRSGRKGGRAFIQKYGKKRLEEISKIGRRKFQKRIESDEELKENFRKMFIERMKKFTKIFQTKSGFKVRSKLEQEVANYLTEKGVEFSYESLRLPTRYGVYEPDFVIKDKIIIEVLGMDTDFYLKKKIPKLKDAIANNRNFQWIILTSPNISVGFDFPNCFVTSKKEELVNLIKGLPDP